MGVGKSSSVKNPIAKTLGLMGYYANLQQKLNDKLSYISKIKKERNQAQDQLFTLKKELNLSDNDSVVDYVLKMKKTIDNQPEHDKI